MRTLAAPRTSLLGSKLYRAASPSAALYLEWSCSDMIAAGALEKLSPTVFRRDDTLIVVRHLSGLAGLPEHRRLIYVIDDDWRGGLGDPGLPWLYRAQLRATLARVAPALERRATTLAVSSGTLAAAYRRRFPEKFVVLLEPAWPAAEAPLASARPLSVAYLSAWSHAQDFEFLKPVIDAVMRARPETVFTITENARIPKEWAHRGCLQRVPAMAWPAYRGWMRDRSFDIALYPVLPGPFGAARSRNKLLEFDQFGAAILASGTWEAGRAAAVEDRCIGVGDAAEDWRDALNRVLDTVGLARRVAGRNRARITRDEPVRQQRRKWETLLAAG